MTHYETQFASLRHFSPGHIELVDDDVRRYAFSNIFDVAGKAAPYEKIVVAKHLDYVIEVLRAEGESPWFLAAHDEFALVMDGSVRIELAQVSAAQTPAPDAHGARRLDEPPAGAPMGHLGLRRGHQGLLPRGAAYRFRTGPAPGVIVLQTMRGPLSIERWADICRTR